jgi:hypothetical protein
MERLSCFCSGVAVLVPRTEGKFAFGIILFMREPVVEFGSNFDLFSCSWGCGNGEGDSCGDEGFEVKGAGCRRNIRDRDCGR